MTIIVIRDPKTRGKERRPTLVALLRHHIFALARSGSHVFEKFSGLMRFAMWIPALAFRLLRNRPEDAEVNNFQSGLGARVTGFGDIPTAFINLDHRLDRKRFAESELLRMGFGHALRFSAAQETNGSLGCAKSHIAVLERFRNQNQHIFAVFEDDIEFVCEPGYLKMVVEEFVGSPKLDILCLSYRLRAPGLPLTPHLSVANNIQTTAGYLIRKRAIPTLLDSFYTSEEMLTRGVNPKKASIDVVWKKKQRHGLLFSIPKVSIAKQRVSHSDIVGRVKDYGL